MIYFWLGTFMIFVVLVLAGALLFSDFYIERLSGGRRHLFILVLIAYATYRGYRTYVIFKHRNDHEE